MRLRLPALLLLRRQKMSGLLIVLVLQRVRSIVKAIMECESVRRIVWALAVMFLIGCLLSGRLSIKDILIEIALNIIVSWHPLW